MGSSEWEDIFASLHALSGPVQSARTTITIIGTAEAFCTPNRREHVVEPDGQLVRLYEDMRLSAFDQVQSALWPVDLELTAIAEEATRSTNV